jgi:hypothetical protein
LARGATRRSARRHFKFFSYLTAALCEAVEIKVRYTTPDINGETRAERNERFSVPVPDIDVPEVGQYLWDWFEELSSGVNRIVDGRAQRCTWAEFHGWRELTGETVTPDEWAILRAMDLAYCGALQGEIDNSVAMMKAPKKRGAPGAANG